MSLRRRLQLYMRIGFLQGFLDEIGNDPNAQGYDFLTKEISRCRREVEELGESE